MLTFYTRGMQNYVEKYEISYLVIQGGGYTFLLIRSKRRYQPEKEKSSEISHNMNTSLLQMTKEKVNSKNFRPF